MGKRHLRNCIRHAGGVLKKLRTIRPSLSNKRKCSQRFGSFSNVTLLAPHVREMPITREDGTCAAARADRPLGEAAMTSRFSHVRAGPVICVGLLVGVASAVRAQSVDRPQTGSAHDNSRHSADADQPADGLGAPRTSTPSTWPPPRRRVPHRRRSIGPRPACSGCRPSRSAGDYNRHDGPIQGSDGSISDVGRSSLMFGRRLGHRLRRPSCR